MRKQQYMGYVLAALATLCLLSLALAGCGGGGGGGSTPPPPPDTINGTLTNNGTPTTGDGVEFDDLPSVTGAVGAGGAYTLTVPVKDITGNDNLWFFDSNGQVLDVVPITMPAGGGNTLTPSTALPVVPPPPGCFAAGAHC
ncbi:MAG TPA: hypothetical protein VFW40_13595 [Capsulimonadaceae bacterium]|nr:hypothetical protein [Capsulimonadaceae bacterium]